jgi:hypothetical protein
MGSGEILSRSKRHHGPVYTMADNAAQLTFTAPGGRPACSRSIAESKSGSAMQTGLIHAENDIKINTLIRRNVARDGVFLDLFGSFFGLYLDHLTT